MQDKPPDPHLHLLARQRILVRLVRLIVLIILLAGVYYYAIKPLLRMLGFRN
ncbi:MAG: hypothetical protein NW703_01510 [Nitrospiraceae bacterium]